MTDCTLHHNTTGVGHVLLLGHGSQNCVMDNIRIPQAYDYACVVKNSINAELKNCDFTSGTSVLNAQAALYFKGGIGSYAHNNILRAADGACFQMLKAASGTMVKPKNCTSNYNQMIATGAAKCLYIGTDALDLDTGNVNDYNTYTAGGAAKYGIVRADLDCQTLAEVQAAWAGYGDGSNDSHST
jgi:hypothetical protein